MLPSQKWALNEKLVNDTDRNELLAIQFRFWHRYQANMEVDIMNFDILLQKQGAFCRPM